MTPFARLRLLGAFLRRQRAQATVLVLLGALLGATVTGLASVRDSAESALTDSLNADVGQKEFALQTSEPKARAVLKSLASAAPVQDVQAEIARGALSTPVLLRITTDRDLALGVLVDGKRPANSEEIALSRASAQSLGLKVGDEVQLEIAEKKTAKRVVGLLVDPADSTNRTALTVSAGGSTFQPTRWLSDTDFYSAQALQPMLDRRVATYQSLDSLRAEAQANRPQFLSALQFLPTGFGLLLALLLLVAISALASRWKRYCETFVAAGMSLRQAVSVMAGTGAALVAVGVLSGTLVALTALLVFRTPVSGWLGQDWAGVTIPWVAVTAMLVSLLAVACSSPLAVRAAPAVLSTTTRKRRQRPWLTPIAIGGFIVSGVAWLLAIQSATHADDGYAGAVPWLGAIMAGTLPFALAPALRFRARPATSAVLSRLFDALRPVSSLTAVVAVVAGTWVAQTTYSANSGEASSSPLQPAGSFVVSSMPDDSLSTFRRIYAQQGGREVISIGIPDETSEALRSTSAGLVTCMSERKISNPDQLPDSCFPNDAAAPINTVGLQSPESSAVADPHLLRTTERVGLLLFPADSPRASRLAETSARPDANLGGNLPGLVVPADGKVAREFGLKDSGASTVLLKDFSELTARAQVYIRSAALRISPGAQTADGTDPTAYDRLRSLANTVGGLGSVASLLVMLLGAASLTVAHVLLRRTVSELGSASWPRLSLLGRTLALPSLTLATCVPLIWASASFGGRAEDYSYGLLWLIPPIAAFVGVVVLGSSFWRSPPSNVE